MPRRENHLGARPGDIDASCGNCRTKCRIRKARCSDRLAEWTLRDFDRRRVRSSPSSLPRIRPYRNWHSQFLLGTLGSNTDSFGNIERAPTKAFGSATRTTNENTIFWIHAMGQRSHSGTTKASERLTKAARATGARWRYQMKKCRSCLPI